MPSGIHKEILEFLFSHLENPPIANRESDPTPGSLETPLEIQSFEELVQQFRERLYWTKTHERVLGVMLAVHLSTKLPGEPLWLYLVGPPSSGKTTLIEALASDREGTFTVNKLTGLYSGHREGRGDSNDYSLLPLMNRRMVLIKDFTSVLTMPASIRDDLFGQLRDIYDGSSITYNRNNVGAGGVRQYQNVHFTLCAGVTDEIHALNNSELGERFLKIDLLDDHGNVGEMILRSMKSTAEAVLSGLRNLRQESAAASEISPDDAPLDPVFAPQDIRKSDMIHIQRATVGFIRNFYRNLHKSPGSPLPEWVVRGIQALAQFVAVVRAKVKRETRDQHLVYRPRRELGTRLGNQLLKLAFCLHTVTGWDWEELFRTIRKVAFDTIYGIPAEVMREIAAAGEKGITRERIALNLGQPATTINRHIANLRELRAIQQRETYNRNGYRGAHLHYLTLTPDLQEAWLLIQDPRNPNTVRNSTINPAPSVRSPGDKKPVLRLGKKKPANTH